MLAEAPAATMKTAAWKHQRAAIEFAAPKPASYLAITMGGGKSRCTCELIERWQCSRVLILCPKSVVSVWPEQFERHCWDPPAYLPLDRGSVAKRVETTAEAWRLVDGCLVVILNYEAAIQPAMAKWLLGRTWDLVVADECHRAKGHRTLTSRLLQKLRPLARRRLALSGTPMPHSPLDIFAQFRFLDPSLFGTSWLSFRNTYAVTDPRFPSRVVRYKHLGDLQERFASIAYRVTSDVLDLPSAQHVRRTCALSPAARRVYRALERDFATTLDEYAGGTVTASNVLAKLLKLQTVTSGFVKDDEGTEHHLDDGKRHLLADVLDEVAPDEPVAVFCRFRRDLDTVRAVAEGMGRGYRELSGRQNDLADWRAGGGVVLGVQQQAGGVGVDLTRARYCVYLSKSYSLGEHEQSLARVHRPGQTRPVVYVHLEAEDTIDQKISAALAARKDVIEALLEGRARP